MLFAHVVFFRLLLCIHRHLDIKLLYMWIISHYRNSINGPFLIFRTVVVVASTRDRRLKRLCVSMQPVITAACGYGLRGVVVSELPLYTSS